MSKIGDPSSKYGYEPNKFDEDIARHRKLLKQKKERIFHFLEQEIIETTNYEDNYNTIIAMLVQLREKYDLMR